MNNGCPQGVAGVDGPQGAKGNMVRAYIPPVLPLSSGWSAVAGSRLANVHIELCFVDVFG